MTTINTSCKVLIPSGRFIHRIKMTMGLAVCKAYLNDAIIETIAKECNLDQDETCRRLKIIREVREVSKLSVEEAYTLLIECNMDQTETCRRSKMIRDIIVVASEYSRDYVYAMLKECNLDQNETSRRLKMIHDVREKVARKYDVDDVYTMLKEFNMDPSEATQRFKYIDSFEVVKKKQDTQKGVVRGKSDNQWRGASRRNFRSSKGFNGTHSQNKVAPKLSSDASGGRNLSSGGVTNNAKRANRPSPVNSRKESNVSAGNVNSTIAASNGTHSHKVAPKLSSDASDGRNLSSGGVTAIKPTPVDSRKESNANGTIISNGTHSHKVVLPKAVSNQNTKYTGYFGTIECVVNSSTSEPKADASGGRNLSSGGVTNNPKKLSSDTNDRRNLSSGGVTNNPKKLSSDTNDRRNLSSGGVTNNPKKLSSDTNDRRNLSSGGVTNNPKKLSSDTNDRRNLSSGGVTNNPKKLSSDTNDRRNLSSGGVTGIKPTLRRCHRDKVVLPKAVSNQNTKYTGYFGTTEYTCYVGSIRC